MRVGVAVDGRGKIAIAHCPRASSFFARLRGLLGRDELGEDTALLIDRCGSVHTVGMRFSLDLVFVDASWRVVRIFRGIPPGKMMVTGGWRARRVYEIEAGRVPLSALGEGDLLEWREEVPAGGERTK